MSKPANKTLIGLFVLGAIALVVIAIIVLGSGKLFKETNIYVCFFEGSVGGLNEGSPVVFRGVKIGSVTSIVLTYDPKDLVVKIPVYIEIDPSYFKPIGSAPARAKREQNLKLLIERGLRARLDIQNIVTGQLQVGLDFHPDKPAKFVGAEPKYPEIPTVPTPLQELAKKIEKIPVEEIFEKLLSAVEGIERVVNTPQIAETIRNLNLTVLDLRKLVRNVDSQVGQLGQSAKEGVADIRSLIQTVDGRIGPLASNLDDAVQDIRNLVQNADAKVIGLASNLDNTVQDIRNLVQNTDAKVAGLASKLDEAVKETRGVIRNVDSRIEPLAASIDAAIQSANATLSRAQKAIEKIGGTASEDSSLVYELNRTLEEVSGLARSIRALSDYLQRHPESALWGK